MTDDDGRKVMTIAHQAIRSGKLRSQIMNFLKIKMELISID